MTVAYDGTNYCGWQIQPNGVTIEEKLNQAISSLFGAEIKVTGASRTDAGVHSLGNVCMFEVETRMPAEKISYALNQRLPDDIVVIDSMEAPEGFHPRFSKSRKTYEYRILNRRFPNPTRRLDTHFFHYPLDVKRMEQAAAYLKGEHDFKSFASIHMQAETSVRTIYDCTVSRDTESDIITIRVTGNGFLYNMVRIIAGTLIKVGCGDMDPEQIPQILAACDRSKAGPTAPAKGLTMIGLEYEEKSNYSEPLK